MIECQSNFIANAVGKLMSQNAASVQVKLTAQNEIMAELTRVLDSTVLCWKPEDDGSKSWSVNDRGWPTVQWPKSAWSYWRETRRLKEEKFVFVGRSLVG